MCRFSNTGKESLLNIKSVAKYCIVTIALLFNAGCTDDPALIPRVGAAIALPESFPASNYTPFGYIDNPYHSAVFNRSGIIRSVPPVGFGFWARQMPWPYGSGAGRDVSYLSFLHLSFDIDGVVFHTSQDFEKNNVQLVSRYHTKTMMSYDWEFDQLSFSAKYFLSSENALVCMLDIKNLGAVDRNITLHATNIYGWPETGWWGSDGVSGAYNDTDDAGVSKTWAYGDVFIIGANKKSESHKSTDSVAVWTRWIQDNDLSSNEGIYTKFEFPTQVDPRLRGHRDHVVKSSGNIYTVQSYSIHLPAGTDNSTVLSLARGVSEQAALVAYRESQSDPVAVLTKQLQSDESFYSQTPLLVGDWPLAWQHGWIYDWQTVRMTIRPPLGIYKHPWDGMQIYAPRQVLAETAIDCMLLSYGDIALAKDVIYGTFADSPAPNIPCTREDGSMNMISVAGDECGTAPNWGLPFHVIHSIYLRDYDADWMRSLYPYLKDYLDWWLENRTDDEGWLYANNSWESGQDGSRRFLVEGEGAIADFVRTIDIEAAMTEAMQNMAVYARQMGKSNDEEYWTTLASDRLKRVQSMYFQGEFRDVDSRTGKPIILKDYKDVMMLTPFATGVATAAQHKAAIPRFEYFQDNPKHWLEWPSYMMIYADAGWNSGLRELVSQVVVETGDRIYARTDARKLGKTAENRTTGLPEQYDYRIPGTAVEYWPIDQNNPGGAENYGWGGTLPIHVLRNVIGFREVDKFDKDEFLLAPSFPASMAKAGKSYGISNLRFRHFTFDLNYSLGQGDDLVVTIVPQEELRSTIVIRDEQGDLLAQAGAGSGSIEFDGKNGQVYSIVIE